MALRTDTRTGSNTGDSLYRTASQPSTTTWSLSVHIYRVTDTVDGYEDIVTMRDNAYGQWVGVYVSGNALIYSDTNGDNSGSTISLNTWYHIGLSKSGGTVQVYLNGVLDINLTGRPNPTVTGITMGDIGNFGNGLPGEHFDGRYAAIKIWSGVALTADQLSTERYYYRPQNLTGLFYNNDGLILSGVDVSGSGNDFTVQGTLALEDGPGIAYAPIYRQSLILPDEEPPPPTGVPLPYYLVGV